MRPDELVALYTPHGVDLQHVAGAASNTKGVARKRIMGPEERKRAKGRPITETAEGDSTRVMRPRTWSHAEVGICAGGLELKSKGKPARGPNGDYLVRCPQMPWLAICYIAGGDRDGYKELHRGLTLKAVDCAKAGRWQWQVPLVNGGRAYYLERLAELVLDTEGCPAHFAEAAKELVQWSPHAIYMGVAEEVWQKPLYGYFLEIQGHFHGWLDAARAVIATWMKPEGLRPQSEADTVASEPSNAA